MLHGHVYTLRWLAVAVNLVGGGERCKGQTCDDDDYAEGGMNTVSDDIKYLESLVQWYDNGGGRRTAAAAVR